MTQEEIQDAEKKMREERNEIKENYAKKINNLREQEQSILQKTTEKYSKIAQEEIDMIKTRFAKVAKTHNYKEAECLQDSEWGELYSLNDEEKQAEKEFEKELEFRFAADAEITTFQNRENDKKIMQAQISTYTYFRTLKEKVYFFVEKEAGQ